MFRFVATSFLGICVCGCGTTREQVATDQLILSDAVDRCVSFIDFTPLSEEKVFLDTQYIPTTKLASQINSEYIISSLRQQMVLAGCLLQETPEEADYIVEARVGAFGRDGHELNFGIPANNTLNTAASLVTSTPPLPSLPEVSFARRTENSAAAKLAVFAYHRESKRPVWQSGLSVAKSSARNRWILGAGPFQSGEIYGNGTRFAGGQLKPRSFLKHSSNEAREEEQAYRNAAVFDKTLRRKLHNRMVDVPDEERLAKDQSEISEMDGSVTQAVAVENQSVPGNQVELASHDRVDSKDVANDIDKKDP